MNFDLDFCRDEEAFAAAQAAAAEARANGRAGPDIIELQLFGEIDHSTYNDIAARLDAAPHARTIKLAVDSTGGDFVACYDTFITIARHSAERKQAKLVRALSGAMLVALGCDQRIAIPNAVILLHPSRMVPQAVPLTARDFFQKARLMEWLDRQLLGIFAYQTGANPREIEAELATEDATPLDRALELGLIHGVGQ